MPHASNFADSGAKGNLSGCSLDGLMPKSSLFPRVDLPQAQRKVAL